MARGALALLWFAAAAPPALAVDPPPAARTFDEIATRDLIYKRVTVLDVSKTHVMFRSAQGFATVRIADLDPTVQSLLRGGAVAAKPAENAVDAPAKQGLKVNAREPADDEEGEAEDDADEGGGLTIEWTARTITGAAVGGIGLLALFIGRIWLICAGFRTSAFWGICLTLGVLDLKFCLNHWNAARQPVCLHLLGAGLTVGGWWLVGF